MGAELITSFITALGAGALLVIIFGIPAAIKIFSSETLTYVFLVILGLVILKFGFRMR